MPSPITVSRATDMSGDAGFRTWGQTYGTNLASLGWVKAPDPGQINWGSVLKPTVANTVAGFEIFQMNDALQATAPVFLKLEYGTGAAATNSAIWITVGFATDGAGGITGSNLSTRTQINTTTNSATFYEWKFCGTTGRLGVAESWNFATGYRYLFVERTHNNDGTDNSTGVMLVFGSVSSSNYSQLITRSGTLPPLVRYNNVSGMVAAGTYAAAASNQLGTNLFLAPVRVFGAGESTPMHGVAGYFSGDLAAGNLTPLTAWDGSSATFLPLGIAPTYFGLLTSTNIAMRFD